MIDFTSMSDLDNFLEEGPEQIATVSMRFSSCGSLSFRKYATAIQIFNNEEN